MLRLDTNPQVWVKHDETGAEFLIKAIEPRDNQKLIKQARDKKGEVDFIVHNGLICDHAIVEWKGIGDGNGEIAASPENKKKLGEKFGPLSNWIFQQATDIKLFMEETRAGKSD